MAIYKVKLKDQAFMDIESDGLFAVDAFKYLGIKDAGKISAEQASAIAQKEFEEYKKERDKDYISDFDMAVKKYLQEGMGQDKEKDPGEK